MSSRSSSPVYLDSSSPPSSPTSLPDDKVITTSSFTHPFAGSTRASHHRFRAYEKKTPVKTQTRFRSLQPEARETDIDSLPGSDVDDDWDEAADASFQSIETVTEGGSSSINMPPYIARARWDDLITEIVENPGVVNSIDLNGSYIGLIPRSIGDLKDVVVLTQTPPSAAAVASEARKFSRAATSPLDFKNGVLERALGRTGSLDRIKSSASFSVPATKVNSGGELRMSLASSGLSSLPAELFQLRFLTSLVLRGNLLTTLPPQIYKLENLRELDISINRFRYLPSELMSMNLVSLRINPNANFLPKPPARLLKPDAGSRVALEESRLRGSSTIPSLNEQCVRVLFATNGPNYETTTLEMLYELPLNPRWNITESVRDLLAASVPKAAAAVHKRARLDPNFVEEEVVERVVSFCPGHGSERRIFVEHVEERFTWETEVAGRDVWGAPVPILWRGCSRGCLDFLDEQGVGDSMSEVDSEDGIINVVNFGSALGFSDDEGM